MRTIRLNESYSIIDSDLDSLTKIFNFLRVLRNGAYFDPLVKCGRKSPYNYFCSIQNKKLLVMNGHLQLLGTFGVESPKLQSEFTEEEIGEYLDSVKKELPFPPYEFQEIAFKESILNVRQLNKMCTGSGKSMTISLIAEFFRRKGMKGLLLVPNINLLTQFKNDIGDYNLTDLYNDTHTIGGGESVRHFNNSLTISTWQSLQDKGNANLAELDYVICDECLDGETQIKTINGEVSIKDLRKDDIVLTLNEESGIYEYKPIVKLHKNLMISSREKMFELEFEDGRILRITGNHKVMTQRGWVRVDELTLDDDVVNL